MRLSCQPGSAWYQVYTRCDDGQVERNWLVQTGWTNWPPLVAHRIWDVDGRVLDPSPIGTRHHARRAFPTLSHPAVCHSPTERRGKYQVELLVRSGLPLRGVSGHPSTAVVRNHGQHRRGTCAHQTRAVARPPHDRQTAVWVQDPPRSGAPATNEGPSGAGSILFGGKLGKPNDLHRRPDHETRLKRRPRRHSQGQTTEPEMKGAARRRPGRRYIIMCRFWRCTVRYGTILYLLLLNCRHLI